MANYRARKGEWAASSERGFKEQQRVHVEKALGPHSWDSPMNREAIHLCCNRIQGAVHRQDYPYVARLLAQLKQLTGEAAIREMSLRPVEEILASLGENDVC